MNERARIAQELLSEIPTKLFKLAEISDEAGYDGVQDALLLIASCIAGVIDPTDDREERWRYFQDVMLPTVKRVSLEARAKLDAGRRKQ